MIQLTSLNNNNNNKQETMLISIVTVVTASSLAVFFSSQLGIGVITVHRFPDNGLLTKHCKNNSFPRILLSIGLHLATEVWDV